MPRRKTRQFLRIIVKSLEKLQFNFLFLQLAAISMSNKTPEKGREMRSPSIMFKDKNDFYSSEANCSLLMFSDEKI